MAGNAGDLANAFAVWEERPKLVLQVEEVRARVEAACRVCGRPAEAVRVVAVAKFQPAEAVAEAVAQGLLDIGENRVQEARATMRAVPGAVWHMIGRLQSNKAALAARIFSWLHSLDRLELVPLLGRAAEGRSDPLQVLVEVNLAGERQKGGCEPEAAAGIVAACRDYPMLEVRGLMTVPPATGDPRPYFRDLRTLLSQMRETFPDLSLDQLSMGMSGDFEAAIAEGATMVRIGTAIFGARRGG